MSFAVSIFLAAMLGDLGTYIITSVLALAFPAEVGGFIASFVKFASYLWDYTNTTSNQRGVTNGHRHEFTYKIQYA